VVHGAVRGLFQGLGAFILGLLILIPVVAWRLSKGPVALDFLTPYIEGALTAHDGSYSVRLDGTVLAMGEGRRMLEIRALGVKAFAGGDQPIATVPQVALTLNGRALLAGTLAPNAVRIHGLRLTLVRDEAGHTALGFGDQPGAEPSGDLARRLIDALVGAPDPTKPGRHLQRASLIGADLRLEDRASGIVWHAPEADVDVVRTAAGLEAQARLTLDLGGEKGMAQATMSYRRADDGVAGEIRLAGVRPAMLARLGGPLAVLSAVDMPLAGTLKGQGTATGTLAELGIDLSGGAGTLSLPNFTRPVAGFVLRGRVFDGMRRAAIDELTVDLGGPTASLAANIDGLGGDTAIKAEAVAHNVPFDSLPELWPAGLGDSARNWVLGHMSKGSAREARITVSARSRSGDFRDLDIESLSGDLHADGLIVDYLGQMPAVKDAACVATFDTRQFRIDIKQGDVFGLSVKEGLIVLSGLDLADQAADIELAIVGPFADALRLVDSPPLHYAAALGIKPSRVGGESTTRLKMKFPLRNDLQRGEVDIKARSNITAAKIPDVLMGMDVTQGDLALDVDGKGMDVTGAIQLGTIPAKLQWRENFGPGAPFRSRYTLQAAQVDEAQRRLLGLDGPPFVAPWMEGPVGADVTVIVQPGGRADIEARADLSTARMSLPGLGWHKEERTTGSVEATLRLEKSRLAAVPRFQMVAGDLQTRGAVSFGPEGKVRRVDFQKLAYGRTDVDGSITFRKGGEGMDIAFKGGSFDARSLIGHDDDAPAARPKPPPRKKDDLPPMTVSGAVKALWLSKPGRLIDATATLQHDDGVWRSVALKGTVGNGKNFDFQIQPSGPKRRSLKATSDDAGSVLRAFDVYSDLIGGSLDVDGSIDDDNDAQPLDGALHVADYSVVNAPALARLLTVAAVTGVVDVLRGEGISFTGLVAPFTLTDGLLQVKDARAYGPALGLTAKGQIDFDRSRMALEGTVVPAYAINSVLGNIPVLGWLVTGGDKGGGLWAFNFSMKGPTDDPEVVVNPLSGLTPGFLRKLFNIFDDGSGTDARRKR